MQSDTSFEMPEGVTFSRGILYEDLWVVPELCIRCQCPADLDQGNLRITFWNPDISTLFHNNAIEISLNGSFFRISDIKLLQLVDIDVTVNAGELAEVNLRIERFLAASRFDDRDRAAKLVQLKWVDSDISSS